MIISHNIITKYYEPNELTPLLKSTTNNTSFFHLNIFYLCFHIEKLTNLICEHDLAFDIIGISECRLKLNKEHLNSVQIPSYNFEFSPTERNNGGTTIYIKSIKF